MNFSIRRPGLLIAFSSLVLAAGDRVLADPVITATKDDNVPSGTRLQAGDGIDYRITISNTGDTEAAGVVFTDPTPAGTTLVADSVNVSPLAGDDAYNAIGNTLLRVGGTAGSGPEVFVPGGSVLGNDREFLGDGFTVVTISGGSSAQGGTVNLAADGSFTYLPPAGFTGTDTFSYTIKDDGADGVAGNADDLSGTGTVTITVSGMVWYVNAGAPGGGSGRSTAPLQSLSTLAASNGVDPDGPGDAIFLYSGSYTGGIALESGQRLIGQGSDLVVGSITLVTGAAASAPTLSHTAGSTVTLSTGNTVSGLHLTNSGGNGISGSNVGTLTLADFDVTLTSTNNAHTALNVTGSGTVTASGAANFLSTVSGAALNVANVAIGAGGLNFKSITAGNSTAAADPVNGIVLTNTGSAGGLMVTGDSAAANNGSGGTIQRTTGSGIALSGVSLISLSRMNILNSGEDGIEGTNVSGLDLTRCTLTSNGDDSEDCGIKMTGLTGTCAWANTNVTGSALANVSVTNTSGTLSSFSITGGIYGSLGTASGANSILINMAGSSVLADGSITGNTISNNNPARGLTLQAQGNANVEAFLVQNNTFAANGLHASFEQSGAAALSFNFTANGTAASPMTGSLIQAVNVFTSSQASGGSLYGKVTGNFIGNAAVAESGSTDGGGIQAILQGQTSTRLLIDGNTIRQTDGDSRGISVAYRGPASPLAGSVGTPGITQHLTLTNNNVTPGTAASGFPLAAIMVEADNQTESDAKSPEVFADIRGNTVPVSDAFDFESPAQLVYYEYDAAGGHGVANLFKSAGAANAAAQLSSTNTGSTGVYGVSLSTTPVLAPPLLFAGSDATDRKDEKDQSAADGGTVLKTETEKTESSPASSLRESDLAPLVSASLARWEASGLTEAQRGRMKEIVFSVSDMPGQHLGLADGQRIILDADAAGNGWFIDPTPADDSEFATGSGTRLTAVQGSAPAGKVDALTTILHELGHAAGLEDSYHSNDRDSLMYGFLQLSERRLPRPGQAANAVPHEPGEEPHKHYLSAPITIGTLPPGKSVTVVYRVTVDAGITSPGVSNQGTVSADGLADVLTDDVSIVGSADPTATIIEVPPVLAAISASVAEDGLLGFTGANFTGGFSDANGDSIGFVRIVSLPAHGTLKLGAVDVNAGQDITAVDLGDLNYTPAADYNGSDSFNWNASDGTLLAVAGAQVDITVTPENDNPVAAADTITRYPTQGVKVSKATLLANDTDIDGDTPLTITAVAATSVNGGTVTSDGTKVYYTPAAGFKGADSFTYTLSDGHGGTATGTVNVSLVTDNAQGMNITKLQMLPDGSMSVGFAGIPGRTYEIQTSEDLTTWTPRVSVIADDQGGFTFIDAPPLPPTRYYRSVQP